MSCKICINFWTEVFEARRQQNNMSHKYLFPPNLFGSVGRRDMFCSHTSCNFPQPEQKPTGMKHKEMANTYNTDSYYSQLTITSRVIYSTKQNLQAQHMSRARYVLSFHCIRIAYPHGVFRILSSPMMTRFTDPAFPKTSQHCGRK